MADASYVVTHTMISGGYVAGDIITPTSTTFKTAEGVPDRQGMGVTNLATGLAQELDLDRLVRLSAIREATEADKVAGGLPDDGILLGDAPDGLTRVSGDTFAALDPMQSTGGNQSDVGKPRPKKGDAPLVPAGTPQADPSFEGTGFAL